MRAPWRRRTRNVALSVAVYRSGRWVTVLDTDTDQIAAAARAAGGRGVSYTNQGGTRSRLVAELQR